MTISDDFTPTKANFVIWWSLANTLGLSMGWAFGELVGRAIESAYGREIGHLVGVLVFEIFLWTARGMVLSRVKRYKILRPLDILIWVITEIFGWMVNSSSSSGENLMRITGGATLAASWGAMMWLLIWFMRIAKPGKDYWFIRAFFWTFVGFIVAALLFGIGMAASLQIGYLISNMGTPIIGMAIAGAVMGVLLGFITGLAMLKLLKWPAESEKVFMS